MIQTVRGSHAIKWLFWACEYKNMLLELTRQFSSASITDILQYVLLKYTDAWLRCLGEYIIVRIFHYVFFHVFEVLPCCTARCALVVLKLLYASTCSSMQQNCGVGVWYDSV